MDRETTELLIHKIHSDHSENLSVIGAECSTRQQPSIVWRSVYSPGTVVASAKTFDGLLTIASEDKQLNERLWQLYEDDALESLLEIAG